MTLDLQVRAMIEAMAATDMPVWETLEPAVARQVMSTMTGAGGPKPEIARVEDVSIPTAFGRIGARIYRPSSRCDGLILFYHGGGWVLGDLDTADILCRTLALRTGCAVLSVDYRLAPEHPFPAAVDDSFAALRWAIEHVESLAGVRVPIIVAGESAGANLAAVVAMLARDAGIDLAFQLLFYPATDAACDTLSHEAFGQGPILTRSLIGWFWGHYVPEETARNDPRASPLRAGSFAGLAPALIQTAEHDPLRDEGEAYGAALAQAGVRTIVQRLPGLVHGYAGLASVISAADQAVADAAEAVRIRCAELRAEA